ncbi:MAG: hypothetical protein EBV15_08585 [Bacteroidetes bacterium]|nr:hypothetical protein [Bacteroidota bacterium]
MYRILSVFCFLCFCSLLKAQPLSGNKSYYLYDTLPINLGNGQVETPFTGGFNSPQFVELDLNNDGSLDMVVFDRHDQKILPYIRKNGRWIYDTRYEKSIPRLNYWIRTADLNGDNKQDIFTLNTISNLVIHLNITQPGDKEIKFKDLGSQYFRNKYDSTFFINYNPLGLSKLDLPHIGDLDNDGDVDIVFYDPYNRSYSMFRDVRSEKGWSKDTFEFQDMDYCFGYFNEGLDNSFVLGQCIYKEKLKPRHVGGASLLMFDNDEDGDYEMLASNVGFKKMTLLKNAKAQRGIYYDTMVQVDSIFPANTRRAADFVFPAAYLADADADGVKDLLLSPAPSADVKETQNIWYYKNYGKDNKPDFKFVQTDWLTDKTVDLGAKSAAAFCDYDNDGDKDLFVASNGDFELTGGLKDRITLFENKGTKTLPNFVKINDDYLNISQKGIADLIIKFGDVDGDKDIDMYYGERFGKVGWFRNTAGAGKPLNLVFAEDDLLKNTVNPGMENAAPALCSYNGDTLPDMLVGMYNGRVALYVNQGSVGAPTYVLALPNAWGMRANEWSTEINPAGFFSYGYAMPEVTDVDNDGQQDVLLGTSFGKVRMYKPTGRSIYDSLSAIEGWLWQRTANDSIEPDLGNRVNVAAADLNNDSIPELIFGNGRGGLHFAKIPTAKVAGLRKFGNLEIPKVFPNPAFDKVTITRKTITEKWSMTLLDASGRFCRQWVMLPGERHFSAQIIGFSPGFYTIHMDNGQSKSAVPLYIGIKP